MVSRDFQSLSTSHASDHGPRRHLTHDGNVLTVAEQKAGAPARIATRTYDVLDRLSTDVEGLVLEGATYATGAYGLVRGSFAGVGTCCKVRANLMRQLLRAPTLLRRRTSLSIRLRRQRRRLRRCMQSQIL